MEHMVFLSHSSADKEVANAICHHLESKGLRCWIAPRDIDTSNWAGSIMDGLRKCDVFVVVISHNSIQSQEVTKEVTLATQFCQYILPFKVDRDELNDHLRYHLSPCHWLDAVTPPLEKRIGELEQRIRNLSDKDAVYLNQYQRKLVEKISYPRGLFVGREQEIEEIAQMLEEEHVLFLQGMGGIGKSEIAKAYAKTYRSCYDTIVFAGYQGSILEMVNGDAISIENLRRGSAETESPEAYFARKLETLKALSSERTLLIVDNFDVDSDPYLEDLINGPYHIIITTRNEHLDYPTLLIDKIRDFDKVRQIFAKHYGKRLSPADTQIVDQILNLVNCHTITVELIAKQMRSSHKNPAKMLEILKNTGTNTKLSDHIKHTTEDAGMSSFDYIRQMFQISGLSEAEKHILCCMCMVPYTGIDIGTFSDWCKLESYDDVNSLLAKSWLMLDEETDVLSLHPVICDVVKAELEPTPLKCKDYIIGLWEIAKDCWFFTTEERAVIAPFVAFIQKNYPEPCTQLQREYGSFINIAWMCSNFELSQKSGHVFYDFTLRTYGPDSFEAGRAASFLAAAYHNAGDNVSAEPYYKLGLEHRLAALGPDAEDVGVSYAKLGRCAYYNHDFETSLDYLNKSIGVYDRLYETTADPELRRMQQYRSGDTVVEFERLYMEIGDYESALKYCQESYNRFLLKNGKETPNSVYSLVDMGICCSKLGRFQEAEHYLNRALEINIRFQGEASVQTVRTREAIADNLMAMGRTAEARQQYLQLELDLERDFGPTNPQVQSLRAKREAAE